jgi:hypothetical protein
VFVHGGNAKKLQKLQGEYLNMCKENQLKLEKQLEDRAEQIVKLEMK